MKMVILLMVTAHSITAYWHSGKSIG